MDTLATSIRSARVLRTPYAGSSLPPGIFASPLERHFARIANEIVSRWGTDRIEPYMNSLLIDTRGGRQGFPADVLDDLVCLSGMLWHLASRYDKVQDTLKLDTFSFSAINEADMRRCGTSGAWVLG